MLSSDSRHSLTSSLKDFIKAQWSDITHVSLDNISWYVLLFDFITAVKFLKKGYYWYLQFSHIWNQQKVSAQNQVSPGFTETAVDRVLCHPDDLSISSDTWNFARICVSSAILTNVDLDGNCLSLSSTPNKVKQTILITWFTIWDFGFTNEQRGLLPNVICKRCPMNRSM